MLPGFANAAPVNTAQLGSEKMRAELHLGVVAGGIKMSDWYHLAA